MKIVCDKTQDFRGGDRQKFMVKILLNEKLMPGVIMRLLIWPEVV